MSPKNGLHNSQNGSALLIAVFVVVVMAVLMAGISRSISSSVDQTAYEVLGIRALLAADTGTELALMELFPHDTPSGTTSCADVTTEIYMTTQFVTPCVVAISCQSNTSNDYFQIQSTGTCKSSLQGSNAAADFVCSDSEMCVSRSIEVEAKP